MTRKLLIISALCFLAALSSCKRAPLTIGSIVTQERELPDFTEVHVNDYINITLVRSDTCYIKITTGKNIIDNITTDVNNGILTICNTTTCNWARPYNYECIYRQEKVYPRTEFYHTEFLTHFSLVPLLYVTYNPLISKKSLSLQKISLCTLGSITVASTAIAHT